VVVLGAQLGVDYGTLYTRAVLRRPDGTAVPLLFDGSPLLRSAVALDPDGLIVVGQAALRGAGAAPDRFEPAPKRHIDEPYVRLGGLPVPVVALIAATFREVLREARREAGGVPFDVVLTHPASWSASRVDTLTRAAQGAGISSVTLVADAVAAARAHGPVKGDVVVYDLGAGTFDVTALRVTAAGITVRGARALPDVSGREVDAAVVAMLRAALDPDEVAAWDASPSAEREGWRAARTAKEALSRRPSKRVPVPGTSRTVEVTRDELERAAGPLIERTVDVTRAVLRTCGLSRPDRFLLVGGATRMPLVASTVQREFGIAPVASASPELDVAIGAAEGASVQAAAPPGPPSRRTGRGMRLAALGVIAFIAFAGLAQCQQQIASDAPAARPAAPAARTAAPADAPAAAATASPGEGITVTAAVERRDYPCPADAGSVRFVGTITVDRSMWIQYRWRRSLLDPTPAQVLQFFGRGTEIKTVSLDWAPGEGRAGWRTLEVIDSNGNVIDQSAPVEYQIRCAPQFELSAPTDPWGGSRCPYTDPTPPHYYLDLGATVTVSERPVVIRYRWVVEHDGGQPFRTATVTTTMGGIGPGQAWYRMDSSVIKGPFTARLELIDPAVVTSPPARFVCASRP
jgi:actin-like ATPase involved in cell morphogenesis